MVGTTVATGGLVYGIRLKQDGEYRYVGITTKTASRRFHQHLRVAAEGRKTPFYDWLRKHDEVDVAIDELDRIEGLPELGQAEIDWIGYLKRQGDRLLNLSDGGLGPTGVVWTEEQRQAARLRSTGRKGLSFYLVPQILSMARSTATSSGNSGQLIARERTRAPAMRILGSSERIIQASVTR